jgi:uncharacterized Tic20 family protein
MDQAHPFTEPPDPFSAVGPDGGHFQPGAPQDIPQPGAAPPPPPSYEETRRAHRRYGHAGQAAPPPGSPPPPPGAAAPGAAAGATMIGEERMWSTLIPLSTFVAAFIGPLVLWLIFRDQYPGVDRTGRETLNFQISLVIYAAMFGVLSIILVGIPFLVMLPFFGFVCTVIAAFRTSRGELYRYPLSIRLL